MRGFGCVLTHLLTLATMTGAVLGAEWPQFRGVDRDGTSAETGLYRGWPAGGPKVLWKTDVCQGYSAAAIVGGRVYFNDYGRKTSQWFVRCLLLSDGAEQWRFKEKRKIRPNHGITRTVPAVDGKYVFAMDPKCVLHCLDAKTGKEQWRKNLVKEYKTRIPPWYTGQCPLFEKDRVIVAPGGTALIAALAKDSGEPIWQTPNPEGWNMSHVSLMPTVIDGVKQYLYATLEGLLGVDAADGKLLWHFPWKFNVAVAPSPLAIGDGRIFLTSCYDADGVMIRVKRDGERFVAEKVFTLPARKWNSEVHTPVIYKDHLFGVGKKKRGLFTCLDMNGNQVWTSAGKATFGLGSYLLADGLFFILDGDTGMLRLLEAGTKAYKELASAQVLSGHDVWGPMALVDGRLVLRDMTKMVCIEVGKPSSAKTAN